MAINFALPTNLQLHGKHLLQNSLRSRVWLHRRDYRYQKNEHNRIIIVLSSINVNGKFIADDGLAIMFDDIIDLDIITPGIEANFQLIQFHASPILTPKGFELPITCDNEIDLWYLVAFHRILNNKLSFADWLKTTDIESFAKLNKLKFGKPISLKKIDESKQKHFRTKWENDFCRHWSSFDFGFIIIIRS